MKKTIIIFIIISIIGVSLITVGIFLTVSNNKRNNQSNDSNIINKDDDDSESLNKTDSNATVKFIEGASVKNEVAVDNSNVYSEKEAKEVLTSRGFDLYDITYSYTMSGEYVDETSIDISSDEKHPMYTTMYASKVNNSYWTIYLAGKKIFAYPFSYILDSDSNFEIIVSETDDILSYDDKKNKFYIIVPNDQKSSLVIKTINKIDSKSLDNYKFD